MAISAIPSIPPSQYGHRDEHLWPRFIVLASLSVMFILYYFLARDEEKRMINLYGRSYEDYRDRTGMFVPKWIERDTLPGYSLKAHCGMSSYPFQ